MPETQLYDGKQYASLRRTPLQQGYKIIMPIEVNGEQIMYEQYYAC
jgi:hypothetical protein